ncbi:TlpA family protein disulfide reductase [Mucilaginibacter sp. OK098]|uniref:TlpA family protein disulfide reductase n=1 Tax=Mucilaginibacter sp. OK098 TaxID=1855297 RepID=UPI0013565C7A|nr:thioredoxin domain-containing protein [Mucilaginibacter sp. OK098]
MKKLVFFLCLIAAVSCSSAQTFTPPPAIPPYKILTSDSVNITPANLKKDKATMIIYFAPDCSHCQHLMFELKPHMKELKNVQVIMITFVQQIKAIQVFARDFDLKKYPNWTVGTEGYTYKVQQYYHVATTPYIAIYDKIGKPVKYIDKDPKVEDILAATKKL